MTFEDAEMATDERAGQFARIRQLELSLRNVLGLSQRLRRKAQLGKLTTELAVELAGHFTRFCAEAGVKPSILRGDGEGGDLTEIERSKWQTRAEMLFVDRLKSELTQARARIAELEATYQQAFGCHHSWVEQAAKLRDAMRSLAEKWASTVNIEWDDIDDLPADVGFQILRNCASELTAALDALEANRG